MARTENYSWPPATFAVPGICGETKPDRRKVAAKVLCWHRGRVGFRLHPCPMGLHSSHHSGVGKGPYVAVYGSEPRLGLAGFRLPPELLEGVDDEEGLEVAVQLAGLAQTDAVEQVTGTNNPSNVIDLEKEVALGVDSGTAHEDNVESETDMAEHENVKVGEGTGACSGNLSHLSPINIT